MGRIPIFKASTSLSASLAILTLAACNQPASQNGAYVAGSTSSAAAEGGQALPPSNEYQAVADRPPPPLPVYNQPPIPEPGYIWTPGYWDWSDGDADYYWVPGTWIEPPSPGVLWTPGYWRYYNGRYLFSTGYWGPEVGFYGGVDYGYGYGGVGYGGGRWQGNRFYYNDQVNNLGGRRFETVYSQPIADPHNRASFNGGPGGLRASPTPAEMDAARAPRHIQPTSGQQDLVRMASAEPQLRAKANGGSPSIMATPRPAEFHATGGISAHAPLVDRQPMGRPAPAEIQPQDRGRAGGESVRQGPMRQDRPSAPAYRSEAPRPTAPERSMAPTGSRRAAPSEGAPPRAQAPTPHPSMGRPPPEVRAPEARPAPAPSRPAASPEHRGPEPH